MAARPGPRAERRRSPLRRETAVLYRRADFLTRLRARLRILNLPLEEIDRGVPPAGTILEIGCGDGVVANYLALAAPARRVLGIDISEVCIASALSTVGGRDNIAFSVGRLRDLPPASCEGIVLSDVLYLMGEAEGRETLAACAARLAPGGSCVIKTVDFSSRRTLLRARIQERIMRDVLRLTRGSGRFAFRGRGDWDALIRGAGLEYSMRRVPATAPPLAKPSWIFLCRRPR
ncbi:MAG: class I SAM-dependent methyltransferase [bacterium]|nr:class I SAM-dependent methyltransferase [bacterium]